MVAYTLKLGGFAWELDLWAPHNVPYMNLKYGWQYMQYSMCHMVWAELPLRGNVDVGYIVNISKSSVACTCISVEMTSVDILSTLCFFASGCLRVPP
jgi:hypothetical protein